MAGTMHAVPPITTPAWNDASMSRPCLGTAQWGSPYGVTNITGRMTDAECAAIIAVAREAGITDLDTAAGYGDAQLRLQPWAGDFTLTTKVAGSDPALMIHALEASLMELGVEHVQGVLIHDWEQLNADGQVRVVDELEAIVDRGLATDVGVSVYQDSGIDDALAAFAHVGVRLGLIQVPANPLDQRLNDSASIGTLHDQGARVQVRSVFLQGLLAGPSVAQLASHPDVVRFHQWTAEQEQHAVAVCLSHIRSLPWADEIVVGVTSADELRTIMEMWNGGEPERAPVDLGSVDLALIDPRRW